MLQFIYLYLNHASFTFTLIQFATWKAGNKYFLCSCQILWLSEKICRINTSLVCIHHLNDVIWLQFKLIIWFYLSKLSSSQQNMIRLATKHLWRWNQYAICGSLSTIWHVVHCVKAFLRDTVIQIFLGVNYNNLYNWLIIDIKCMCLFCEFNCYCLPSHSKHLYHYQLSWRTAFNLW